MKTDSTKNEKRNENIQSGVSAVAGAGIGVVAAMTAETAFATETETEGGEPITPPVKPNNTTTPANEPIQVEVEQETVVVGLTDVNPEPEFIEVTVDGSTYIFADIDNDGIADVIASDLNHNGQFDEGESADISHEGILMADVRVAADEPEPIAQTSPTLAEVEVDGITYHFADVNNDGIADLGAVDLNGNGVIDDSEVSYIENHGIMMADLDITQTDTSNQLAYNDDLPDYTNDANVDEYMA